VAGVVVRVGALVRKFKPGDEVYARPDKDRIGTFAEFIAVDEDDLAPKPARLTMAEAAAIPLVGLTAWQALVEIANLRAGQRVFIHAGAGGVGTFAIQLAKHLGATVATTTSAAKRRRISYSFLFMRANGDQLREITSLIDAGIIQPIVDQVFPFESTNEAVAYVEKGRAKGKVVVTVKQT
jgi:NADPH:quinone reductase-like Zn-dependent oxidoreductase